MRNGNVLQMYQIRKLILGSYRTYEEWKQIKDGYVYVIEGKVLTVPMRNGNWHYFMWG